MWRSTTMWYAFKGVNCITSWNSMPLVTFVVLFIVPVPLLAGAVPQFVEQWPDFRTCSTFWGAVPHLWDAVPQIVELFHFLWNCSIKSGTVPLCFGLLGYCPNLLLVEWYSILSVIFFYEDVMWFIIGCFLWNSLVWINGNSTLWQRLKLFLFGRNLENLRLNKLWTALIALYLNKLEDEFFIFIWSFDQTAMPDDPRHTPHSITNSLLISTLASLTNNETKTNTVNCGRA